MRRFFLLNIFLTHSLFAQNIVQYNMLEADMVITGERKIPQHLDEIAISATQITEKKLEDAGISNVRSAVHEVPGVLVIGSSSPKYTTPYIRGQGSQDAYVPDDASVSFYLDEVPLPRYFFASELVDIERIDVLRGPQGTLFGKNTQGGAINLVTKDPNIKDGHKISLEYGNLERKIISAKTNFKLFFDKLKNRLSVTHKTRDSWIQDTSLNKKFNDNEVLALHNTLAYNPSGTLKFSLKFGLQKDKGTDSHVVAKNIDGYSKTHYDTPPNYESNLYTSSLKVVKEFEDIVLTAIASFNYYDFDVAYDESDLYILEPYVDTALAPFPPAMQAMARPIIMAELDRPDVFYKKAREHDRQYFGELRLKNKEIFSPLNWTVGLNYSKTQFSMVSDVNTVKGLIMAPPFLSYKTVKQDVTLSNTNIALFAEATQKMNERFSLTFGGRGVYDQKKMDAQHEAQNLAVTQYQQNSKKDYTDFVGKIALGFKAAQNINSYVSVTRGYQAGGYPSYQINTYNDVAQDQNPYKKSTSKVYELGLKSHFFDKKLRVNSALFFSDIKDKQIRVRTNTTPSVAFYDNAHVDIYGAELEVSIQATHDIEFGTNFSYNNAKFKNSITTGIGSDPIVNKKGDRVANVPYLTNNTHLQFSRYLQFINSYLNFRTSYRYMGRRPGDNNNKTFMESYGLWNFRLSFEKNDYSVALYMENAFNKNYESQSYQLFGGVVASPALPRLYGARLSVNF